jgi:hypothetical protein
MATCHRGRDVVHLQRPRRAQSATGAGRDSRFRCRCWKERASTFSLNGRVEAFLSWWLGWWRSSFDRLDCGDGCDRCRFRFKISKRMIVEIIAGLPRLEAAAAGAAEKSEAAFAVMNDFNGVEPAPNLGGGDGGDGGRR